MLSLEYNQNAYRYMLPEHQHISYLFDIAYEDIFKYINRISNNAELIRKYTNKKIYTGYYYSTVDFSCKFESTFTSSLEKYPIYLYFTPINNNGVIMSAEENTGQHEIVIHVNLSNVIQLRAYYISQKDKETMLFDIDKSERDFKEEMMGHISHEFLHIRQMFCGIDYNRKLNTKSHIETNPIAKQLDNKEKYTKAIQDIPQITDECREILFRCFYLFTKTEMDARVNSSTRYFDSEEKIKQLLTDYKKEKKRRQTPDESDPFNQNLLDFCIQKTYIFNDLDDMNMCLDYMRKHKYAYHLLQKIDKEEDLNFFKFGLEYTIKKYKVRLYKSFYKLLKKYDKTLSEGILECFISNDDTIFFKLVSEQKHYIGDEICN